MKLPGREFMEMWTGAAVVFAALVTLTAINPIIGGVAWIVSAILIWLVDSKLLT